MVSIATGVVCAAPSNEVVPIDVCMVDVSFASSEVDVFSITVVGSIVVKSSVAPHKISAFSIRVPKYISTLLACLKVKMSR